MGKAVESLSKLAFIHPIAPALFTKCAFIADNAFPRLIQTDGRADADGRTADAHVTDDIPPCAAPQRTDGHATIYSILP